MALKKVKGNFERMFDKNLTDLVRGIRNNKDNEAKYIAQCIEEIKQELRQDNINVKSNAVAKLTYLQMCGYDISWAGFNIIEVMSSNRFTCKRIGYLAASQCFHPDSELLMLTTNMIRKDLSSTNQYDAGVALSGLSCFISTDLSRDLANDIMTLMSSTRPYLRMKAVLMMYKVFLRYPEALRPAFPKLKEKLEDPDPSVQSAAVNVICELARKNPKNYLSLAPIFFKLMTTSTNNWMLIKIIKLFGALTPLEPRLGKKLIEPLTNLIHSTSAMSLLYECINTVIAVLISISSGMPNHSASIQLCVQKLRILIEDSDQNLKYLGLLAMSKILKTHPKSVQTHKDLILACLDDKDESIRLRALDLLYGMVSKKNLMEIVRRLLGHMERAEGSSYRDELLFKVIEICSQGSYQYVTNFEWYLTVLVELILLESGSKHGQLIAAQLLDVAIRVQAVRSFAVNEMATLLASYPVCSVPNGTMHEVLYAAAWIVGEFGSCLAKPEQTLAVLLQPRPVPGHILAVYVQNALKLFAYLAGRDSDDVGALRAHCDTFLAGLPAFLSSADIEVQERASSTFILVQLLREQLDEANTTVPPIIECQTADIIGEFASCTDRRTSGSNQASDEKLMLDGENEAATGAGQSEVPVGLPLRAQQLVQEISELFRCELNPVAPKAQRKVQLPDGLDLDVWINTPPASASADGSSSADGASSEDEKKLFPIFLRDDGRQGLGTNGDGGSSTYKRIECTKEELEKMREARLLEQTNNPNYLKTTKKGNGTKESYADIPIAEIALDVPLQIHSTKRSERYLTQDRRTGDAGGSTSKGSKSSGKKAKKRGKKGKRYSEESDSESDDPKPLHIVNTVIELPEGAILSDSEDKNNEDPNDPHRALDIDLDAPLEDERPVRRPAASAISSKLSPSAGGGSAGLSLTHLQLTTGSSSEAKASARKGGKSTRVTDTTASSDKPSHGNDRKRKKKKKEDKEGDSGNSPMILMLDEKPTPDAAHNHQSSGKRAGKKQTSTRRSNHLEDTIVTVGDDGMAVSINSPPDDGSVEGANDVKRKTPVKKSSKKSKHRDRDSRSSLKSGSRQPADQPKPGYEEMLTSAKDMM
ncbi:AP-3 complex subunit delta [Anopheles aquasalis]|uniref:AP-3 complex subunit delta n=1 Tax=Anopheles aquasalis TaxID=42839 RepID=UPI00215B5322|nr:AP-3 complex subunit delta [Anopheles aquasalis]XP_050083863.1 AP-3 complex subunit delta [Anopheles aquasalis]